MIKVEKNRQDAKNHEIVRLPASKFANSPSLAD